MNETMHVKYFVIILCLLGAVATGQAQEKRVFNLQEFNQRGGLPNFLKRASAGHPLCVAYIGGSITAAANGWRDSTFNWLTQRFPATQFRQVNAAIGGTGSNLGVFRLDRDVLAHQPDLVFVEFAVNDGGSAEGIHRSMEGIVRKIWRHNPYTDIVFVYTIAENVVKHLREGRYQPSAQAMEQVAEHYRIPSIHMGVPVIRSLEDGKLVFTGNPEDHPGKVVFTRDRTHPLAASGHPIYADAVIRAFTTLEQGRNRKNRHRLAKPFDPQNWEAARLVSLAELAASPQWERVAEKSELGKQFAELTGGIYKSTRPGAQLRVRVSGRVVGIYDVIGPSSGIVDVSVDGGAPVAITRFDGWCNNYRKSYFFLKDIQPGTHEVVVTVSDKPVDKVGILAKRNIPVDDPQRYAENVAVVHGLMIIGELLQ